MKKDYDYLNITLSIITISILGAFALRPTLVTALKMRKDINEYEELRNKMRNKLLKLGEIQTLLDKSKSDLLLLNELIPDYPNEEKLLKTINDKALLNNVNVTSVDYEFDKTDTNPKSLTVHMSANSGYKSIIKFIKEISSGPRIFEITNIELTEEKDTKTNNYIINMELTGKAYYSLKNEDD